MKKLILLFVSLAALGAGMVAGIRAFLRRFLPQTEGSTRLPGLHGPVEIIRDRWGVPHIYAEDEDDLFFAQGYVHAQDRLWQMELQRRLGAGRLSEVLGEATLEVDRFVRTLGLNRVAEDELPSLPACDAAGIGDLRGRRQHLHAPAPRPIVAGIYPAALPAAALAAGRQPLLDQVHGAGAERQLG